MSWKHERRQHDSLALGVNDPTLNAVALGKDSP